MQYLRSSRDHSLALQLQIMADKSAWNIAFCHPDLGLGAGAERLVVDAAVELAAAGHSVDVYTAYHDPQRCFEETLGGTFSVAVAGGWFPRQFLGRMHAACACVRCLLVACYIAWSSWRRGKQYNVIFVDQVSVVIPLLHLLTSAKVLFYCHFPDLLLAQRRSLLHSLYRWPLDWLEQATTGAADMVLVNSGFTQGIFLETFTRLAAAGCVPEVLYPAVQLPSQQQLQQWAACWRQDLPPPLAAFLSAGCVYLSINRFERKKGVQLAVEALHLVQQQLADESEQSGCKLVIAGGYDKRLAENREHLLELRDLVERRGLQSQVFMLPSFTDGQRGLLLAACQAVVYTPQQEHFGIVPLEAMAAGRPVIACSSGGPKESIVHGHTGLLCDPTPAAFAAAYRTLLDSDKAASMGAQARQRVQDHFSRNAFGSRLNNVVQTLC